MKHNSVSHEHICFEEYKGKGEYGLDWEAQNDPHDTLHDQGSIHGPVVQCVVVLYWHGRVLQNFKTINRKHIAAIKQIYIPTCHDSIINQVTFLGSRTASL